MIKDQDSIRACAVAAMQDGRGYDFVINNAYRMSKDDLARMFAELTMVVYSKYGEDASIEIEQMAADSLENDYWDESEDEVDEAMERA